MTKDKLIELAQVGMGIHSPNQPEYIVCEALIKALAQPPQRKPLTEKQIKEALSDMSALEMPINKLIPAIARAIEAAHNIK